MEAQYELIAEYMTKLTEHLDVNGEQTSIVNFFLSSKEEQLTAFESWVTGKTLVLELDKTAILDFAQVQVAEVDEKISAASAIDIAALPTLIEVVSKDEVIEIPVDPLPIEPLPDELEPPVEEVVDE